MLGDLYRAAALFPMADPRVQTVFGWAPFKAFVSEPPQYREANKGITVTCSTKPGRDGIKRLMNKPDATVHERTLMHNNGRANRCFWTVRELFILINVVNPKAEVSR